MKRNYCVQCFRYTEDGSSELWVQRYFELFSEALKFLEYHCDVYDSVQFYKVK